MPPTQSFDVTLRAERAEAAAVELRARLQSRTVEAHTSLIGVRHADDLTAACEASLKWQLRQVAKAMLGAGETLGPDVGRDDRDGDGPGAYGPALRLPLWAGE